MSAPPKLRRTRRSSRFFKRRILSAQTVPARAGWRRQNTGRRLRAVSEKGRGRLAAWQRPAAVESDDGFCADECWRWWLPLVGRHHQQGRSVGQGQVQGVQAHHAGAGPTGAAGPTELLRQTLMFTPEVQGEQRGYRFSGEGSLVPLLEGLVPGLAAPSHQGWRPQRDTRRAGVLGLFEILRMPINQVNPGSPSSRGRFRCTSIDPVIPPEREKSRDDRPRKVPRLQQASERPHIQPTLRRIFATAP